MITEQKEEVLDHDPSGLVGPSRTQFSDAAHTVADEALGALSDFVHGGYHVVTDVYDHLTGHPEKALE